MTRTNIYFTEEQRKAMQAIAKRCNTKPSEQYRKAVNNHITKHTRKEKAK